MRSAVTPCAGFDRPGAAEHDRRIGLVGRRYRGLFAIDDIFVAVAFDAQPQIGGVRAAPRFGQGDGEESFTRRQAGEPGSYDVRLAVLRQNLAVQRGQEIDIGDAQVGPGDLFVDHAGGEAAEAKAAEFLRQFRRDEPHRAHFLHDRAIENARPVAFLEAWRDAIARKPSGLVTQRNQIVVEIWIHL